MTIPWLGLLAPLGCMVLDWAAVARGWYRFKYVTKPLALLALIGWFSWAGGWNTPQLIWFGIALVASLAGDVFLMVPRNLFMGGLVAFWVAHLAFIVGFNPTLPPFTWVSGVLALGVIYNAGEQFRDLRPAVRSHSRSKCLNWGVVVYGVTITLMLLSALYTLLRPEWKLFPAALVALGGLLFYLSDSMLAIDRFVNPIRNGRLWVRITYHLGQMGLIVGVILAYVH